MLRKSALAVLAMVPGLAAGQSETIAWIYDLKQAQFEARQTGKPLFLVFR